MTRDEAIRILQNFFKSQNVDSPGLNDKNLGGAAVGDLQIFFEYQPEIGALKSSAHIYSFREEPKKEILAGFKQEEAERTTDTGGGMVDYQPENRGLYLSRSYTEPVEDPKFLDDMDRLLEASRVWGGEVLERVATRVFHPEDL